MCVIRLDSFKQRESGHKIIMLFSKRAAVYGEAGSGPDFTITILDHF